MADRTDVRDKVFGFIAELMNIRESEISEEHYFGFNDGAEHLEFDSLDSVEFVMECEDVFEIFIPDEEVEKIKTVKEAIDYLMGRLP